MFSRVSLISENGSVSFVDGWQLFQFDPHINAVQSCALTAHLTIRPVDSLKFTSTAVRSLL